MKLKSCPFCGGKAKLCNYNGSYWYACQKYLCWCDAGHRNSEKLARKAWNRRSK